MSRRLRLSAIAILPLVALPHLAGAEDIVAGAYHCEDGTVLPSVFIPTESDELRMYVIHYAGRQLTLYATREWRDGAEVYAELPGFTGHVWHSAPKSWLGFYDRERDSEEVLHSGCRFTLPDG